MSSSGAKDADNGTSAKDSSASKSSFEQLNLRVIGQDGEVVQFKIKTNTPFRKLMNAYCDRMKLVQQNIRSESVHMRAERTYVARN